MSIKLNDYKINNTLLTNHVFFFSNPLPKSTRGWKRKKLQERIPVVFHLHNLLDSVFYSVSAEVILLLSCSFSIAARFFAFSFFFFSFLALSSAMMSFSDRTARGSSRLKRLK
jgi:hypothetical protein